MVGVEVCVSWHNKILTQRCGEGYWRCFIAKRKIFDKEIVQKDSLTYTVASFHAYLLMKNSRFQRVHSNNWESSSGFQHILMNKFYLLPHCFYPIILLFWHPFSMRLSFHVIELPLPHSLVSMGLHIVGTQQIKSNQVKVCYKIASILEKKQLHCFLLPI